MHGATPHDLLASHGAFLRVLARSLVRDTQRAEDLVQDTYAAALTKPPERGGDLRGWLATALSRRASNLRRGDARREQLERRVARAERVRGVDSLAAEVEFSKRLATHVEALAPPLREALFLRYFEDLPPRRIAARLGVPVSTVKSRLERGLAELRSRLDADSGGRREEWLGAALVWSAPRRPAGLDVATAVVTLAGVALIATSAHQNRVEPPRAGGIASASRLEMEDAPAPLPPLVSDERQAPRVGRRVAGAVERDTVVLRGVVEDLALGAEPGTGRPAVGVSVSFPVGPGGCPDERWRPTQVESTDRRDGHRRPLRARRHERAGQPSVREPLGRGHTRAAGRGVAAAGRIPCRQCVGSALAALPVGCTGGPRRRYARGSARGGCRAPAWWSRARRRDGRQRTRRAFPLRACTVRLGGARRGAPRANAPRARRGPTATKRRLRTGRAGARRARQAARLPLRGGHDRRSGVRAERARPRHALDSLLITIRTPGRRRRTQGQALVPIVETGARGRFVLRDVPAAPVTLLVGSREELERGEPRWTERHDLTPPK